MSETSATDLESRLASRNAYLTLTRVIYDLKDLSRALDPNFPPNGTNDVLTVLTLERHALGRNHKRIFTFIDYKKKYPGAYEDVISNFNKCLAMGIRV